MSKNNLTKEQIESIQNYADNIESIDSFVEAVRQMPGMYIGHIGNKGFINMFREIFQNIIDEIFRSDSPCNMAKITFDESTCTSILEDNGRGIPFDNIIRVFTSEHTSSNYKKQLGQYTSGIHGLGSKCTNALSSKFIVESYILGDARRVEFSDGKPWDKGEVKIPNKENRQGTIITFIPSFEIMGRITVTVEELLQFINMMLPLTPIGTKFYFNGIKNDGTEIKEVLTNQDGIMAYLIDSCTNPMIKPICFSDDTGYFKADVILEYDTDISTTSEYIVSFCNFCPTDVVDSDHVKGFLSGLRKYFVNYMNKVYLVNNNGKKKKKPLRIIESDIRTGLRAVITGACLEPLFTGQAKEILSVAEMRDFMEELTYKSLDEWGRANPNDLQKMCKYFKEIAEIRTSTDDKKVKLSNQYASTAAGLPSKFIKPTKEWKEFFIVEGDSAKGSFNTYRHNPTQGVFPIRGVILNCFEKPESTCLQNAEVAGILSIIGGGYGKNFDINKVKWDKVIACTDADSAGFFIESLLLRLVLRFCPQLILAGKYYKSVAPLYYITTGKGKNKKKLYFTDRIELVQYVQKQFSKSNTITTMDDKKLSQIQIQELLYNNIDYIYELEKVANRYRIAADILEIYLNNRDKKPEDICKAIKKKYRFMNQIVIDDKVVCDGIANGVSNTLILDDKMINDCSNIIKIIEGNLYTMYKVNGVPCTLLDLMTAYTKFQPNDLTRLKGLGEQSGEELAESVILPGDMGNRTLLQYTMDSAMKEIEQIRHFESNKNLLLEGLVVNRIDISD